MAGRVLSLILYRCILVALITGYQLTGYLIGFPILPYWPVLILGGSTALLSMFFTLYLEPLEKMWGLPNLVLVQFFIDLLVISVMVYYTGGVSSTFNYGYLALILLAAIFLDKIGIYAVMVVSVACFYFTVLLELRAERIMDFKYFWSLDQRLVLSLMGHVLLSFFAALLSGFIQTGYKSARKVLAIKERDLKYLREARKIIVETLPSGLITTDLDGNIQFINRTGMNLLRISDISEVRSNVWDLLNLEKPETVGDGAVRAQSEVVIGREKKAFGITYCPMSIDPGSHGWLLVYQDLTRIKMLEAQKRLSERMSSLGKIAAGVAHEIRNPLAAISGSVQVIRELSSNDETVHDLAEIVEHEAKRLDGIISQFLAYTKPANPGKLEPVDLAASLSDFVELARNDSRMAHVQIVWNRPPTPMQVFGDESKLFQIYWNLVRNSAQACSDDGRIEINCSRSEKGIVLEFKDNGKGMTEEELKDLFTPFQSFSQSGTGLGMSIVYELVKLHQGEINVDSEVGRGTVTTLTLPEIEE